MTHPADSGDEEQIRLVSGRTHFPVAWPAVEPAPRIPLIAFLAIGLAAVVALLLILLPAKSVLDRYEARVNAAPVSRLEGYAAETGQLEKKVLDLLTASIEVRLETIESDLANHRATPSQIKMLDDLRQELKILAAYSRNGLDDPGTLDVRGALPLFEGRTLTDLQRAQIREEIAQLRNLFYVGLASCGAVALVSAGLWLQRRRPRRIAWYGVPPHISAPHDLPDR